MRAGTAHPVARAPGERQHDRLAELALGVVDDGHRNGRRRCILRHGHRAGERRVVRAGARRAAHRVGEREVGGRGLVQPHFHVVRSRPLARILRRQGKGRRRRFVVDNGQGMRARTSHAVARASGERQHDRLVELAIGVVEDLHRNRRCRRVLRHRHRAGERRVVRAGFRRAAHRVGESEGGARGMIQPHFHVVRSRPLARALRRRREGHRQRVVVDNHQRNRAGTSHLVSRAPDERQDDRLVVLVYAVVEELRPDAPSRAPVARPARRHRHRAGFENADDEVRTGGHLLAGGPHGVRTESRRAADRVVDREVGWRGLVQLQIYGNTGAAGDILVELPFARLEGHRRQRLRLSVRLRCDSSKQSEAHQRQDGGAAGGRRGAHPHCRDPGGCAGRGFGAAGTIPVPARGRTIAADAGRPETERRS